MGYHEKNGAEVEHVFENWLVFTEFFLVNTHKEVSWIFWVFSLSKIFGNFADEILNFPKNILMEERLTKMEENFRKHYRKTFKKADIFSLIEMLG